MALWNFPGYDSEPRTAESALQEWVDTEELILTEEETEQLYQFTSWQASAEHNIAAIDYGAMYMGLDLVALGYPLPVEITHVDYPHWPGYLYDCAACASSCHCTPGNAECVWVGHNTTEESE